MSKAVSTKKRGITPANKKFPTPQTVMDKFNEYVEWAAENKKIVSISGLRRYIPVYPKTYRKYKSGEYGEDYAEIIEYVEDCIIDELAQEGSRNPKNSYPMFLMKSQHGLSDRPQMVNTTFVNGNIDFHTWKDKDLEEFKQRFIKNRQKEEEL